MKWKGAVPHALSIAARSCLVMATNGAHVGLWAQLHTLQSPSSILPGQNKGCYADVTIGDQEPKRRTPTVMDQGKNKKGLQF